MTSYANPDALVDTEWLARHLESPDVRIVDASWYLPQENRDPKAEYAAAHIPGAVFFDIDEICDTSSDLPHMLPSPEKFASRVRRMGLGDGNRIVVYDSYGIRSASRVWWMFQVFGHDDVAVLNGGLPKWRAEGLPLSDMPPAPRERHFTARMNTTTLRDFDQMLRICRDGSEQIVDARSAERFRGITPEPREGLRGGHIPGSYNVPYADFLHPDQTMIDADEMREAFEDAEVDLSRPIVTTCGSGVTAATLSLALHLIGHRRCALYDGSWTEWASRDDTPVET